MKRHTRKDKRINTAKPVKRPIIALFDLDHTLISSDCTGHWIKFLINRSLWRKSLVLVLIPIIKLCAWLSVDLAKRNSIYLWAATVGLRKQTYVLLRRQAASYVISFKGVDVYSEALERIAWHRQQGHQIIIVTGALRWLARDVCKALDIAFDQLLGSSEKGFGCGRVSGTFCYGNNKVLLLQAAGIFNQAAILYGYSDSAADIPMLNTCQHKYVINPKPRCKHQFDSVFGDSYTLLDWSLLQSMKTPSDQ